MNHTKAPHLRQWTRAARLEDLRGDGPFAISAGGAPLVALRAGGKLRVFEGRCPHQGALLGEGELDGNALVCRNHRWRFDASSGERIGGRQCLAACPTDTRDGELFVDTTVLAPASGVERTASRRLEDVPGPKGLPLLGSALSLDPSRMHFQFEEWVKEYGPLVHFRLGPREFLLLGDAALWEPVYRARPDTYTRASNLAPILAELSASGVFSAEGEAWRRQRRLSMEALAQRHLRGFYPKIHIVAERLVRRWKRAAEEERVLDLASELKRFTVDVTTLLVFGHDVNTLETADADALQRHLAPLFPAFNRRLMAIVPYWRWVRLPADRAVDRSIVEVRAWISERIATTRDRFAADPSRAEAPENFIESMLVARDADGKPFSEDVVFGNLLTMLLGGEDTTAYTLAWTIHHLIDSPSATKSLREDIARVLGDLRIPRDLDQAAELGYATAVAQESMRIRPVAPMLFHEPNRDVVIGDVAVPKGTVVVTTSRVPSRDPQHFRDAAEFIPERWLPGWEGAHEPQVSVPFGSGPRICPGRSLALLEIRVVLAALYASFDVERVGESDGVTELMAFTMTPQNLRVRVRTRG